MEGQSTMGASLGLAKEPKQRFNINVEEIDNGFIIDFNNQSTFSRNKVHRANTEEVLKYIKHCLLSG